MICIFPIELMHWDSIGYAVTKEIKLGHVSQTHSAHPPYKGTEKIPHFQIKRMTICPIRAICNACNTTGISLNILQSRPFWHYDIMSEFTNVDNYVDNVYTNVNNVCKNKR